jgi:hypothetical protein
LSEASTLANHPSAKSSRRQFRNLTTAFRKDEIARILEQKGIAKLEASSQWAGESFSNHLCPEGFTRSSRVSADVSLKNRRNPWSVQKRGNALLFQRVC